MSIKEFDIFVIGSGIAGQRVANACAKAGKNVAITDNKAYGGTCALRGCDPKKVLVGLTEIIERAERMKGLGIKKIPEVNWEDLQDFKQNFTDPVPFVRERELKNAGISLYHQSPKFLGKNTLSVEGKTLKAKNIVIATGQEPKRLHFEGAHHALVSDDFLNLDTLPKRMTFIGGGYIGMELAHIAARFGVEVTVFHTHQRALNNFDPDMVEHLINVSEAIGIKFFFQARADKIEKQANQYKVSADQNGKAVSVTTDIVFMTAGRVPATTTLDLEQGNVAYSENGIAVNKNLQNPSNKSVYACGDVADSGGLPLTPLSNYEPLVVVSHLLKEKAPKKATYPPQASMVFTLPYLARVGLSEKEAKKKKTEVIVKTKNATDWYTAKHQNDRVYAFKTVIEKKTGKILGAHVIGSGAGEIINVFATAMAHNLTANDLKKTVFAYPTPGNDIKNMV